MMFILWKNTAEDPKWYNYMMRFFCWILHSNSNYAVLITQRECIYIIISQFYIWEFIIIILNILHLTSFGSSLIRGEQGELKREVLAGLVVALATVPTSVAYSSVIGLSPLVSTSCFHFIVLNYNILHYSIQHTQHNNDT